MPSHAAVAALIAWARLALVLISRGYRAMLLTLATVAIAPTLFGAGAFVVESGSMMPSIAVGDIVVGIPYNQPEKVAVGRVYTFQDPAVTYEHIMVHRVVELRDDGDYTTAGDANEVTDFTPLKTDGIHDRAILLAPYIGLPVIWSQTGQWFRLALWLLLTIGAFVLATRDLEGEPPKSNLWNLLRGRFGRTADAAADDTTAEDDDAETDVETKPQETLARRRWTAVAAGVALAILATGLGTANAGFTAQTRNSGWSFTVGQWTQPYVEAVLADGPVSFWLLDETGSTTTAQDRSGYNILGTYKTTTTRGGLGALPNNPGTSISTTGALALTSANQLPSQSTHTLEYWFKTGDATGGYLSGFGSSNVAGPAPTEDRVVRLTAAGKITYGDWNEKNKDYDVITTPLSYNNNAWHHVVVVSTAANANRQNTVIYVDGAARVSGLTSRIDTYNGYVRIGGGTGTAALDGSIDNVSIYGTALSAARVAAHYAAR